VTGALGVDGASLLVLLLPLTAGCVGTTVGGAPASGEAPGVAGATLAVGQQRYRLEACRSGDLAHFLGVDLEDRQGGAVVRLVIDPIDGPRVRLVHGRGEARQRLDLVPSRCRRFEADVRPTGWIVNTVRDVSGSVDAECPGDPGPAVSLHARFSHCH
jgi:hypothetical protein